MKIIESSRKLEKQREKIQREKRKFLLLWVCELQNLPTIHIKLVFIQQLQNRNSWESFNQLLTDFLINLFQ